MSNLGDVWSTPSLAWKIVGLLGTGLFAARWVMQVYASRRAGRTVVPRGFWLLSVFASLFLLAYFALGPHRDLIGVMSNIFPAAVAAFNMALKAPAPRV